MNRDKVTVIVGSEAIPFDFPKDVLCRDSGYFRACFNGSFDEAKKRRSCHPDVEVATFEAFAHWLYFKEVVFEDGTKEFCTVKDKDETDDIDHTKTEEAIKIYIFADRFDVRGLRYDIFGIISSYWAVCCYIPALETIRYALENLPDGSPLRKYFIDLMVYKWANNEDGLERFKSQGLNFSPEVLWHLLVRCKVRLWTERENLRDRAPYIEDICQYHEHQSSEDKAACKFRKSGL